MLVDLAFLLGVEVTVVEEVVVLLAAVGEEDRAPPAAATVGAVSLTRLRRELLLVGGWELTAVVELLTTSDGWPGTARSTAIL